ncbi:hypothetical protein BS47DRAFT_1397604 [Hydnum rufescens UP504]|uniref:Uncharacterized protein n=1 Tax=Hydnum rufescens UP504 TaxID=1448309 RepID=A0A9P6AMR9_9AGAM|nr:hypothetical protein BS47DRAFT_1397604 [Hydnum rufescens UP504]
MSPSALRMWLTMEGHQRRVSKVFVIRRTGESTTLRAGTSFQPSFLVRLSRPHLFMLKRKRIFTEHSRLPTEDSAHAAQTILTHASHRQTWQHWSLRFSTLPAPNTMTYPTSLTTKPDCTWLTTPPSTMDQFWTFGKILESHLIFTLASSCLLNSDTHIWPPHYSASLFEPTIIVMRFPLVGVRNTIPASPRYSEIEKHRALIRAKSMSPLTLVKAPRTVLQRHSLAGHPH